MVSAAAGDAEVVLQVDPKKLWYQVGSRGCPGGWLEQMTVSELGRLFSMLYSRQSHHIKDPVDFCLKILLGDSSSSSPHKKILLVCFSLLPSSIFTFRSSDSIFQFLFPAPNPRQCPKT